jgi:hypothetical protein
MNDLNGWQRLALHELLDHAGIRWGRFGGLDSGLWMALLGKKLLKLRD